MEEPIPKAPQKRRCRTRKPKDAVGKDKVYGTYVLQSEIDAVKKAIGHVEQNYLPSTKGIQRITGVDIQRVRATVHFMKAKGMITSTRDKRRRMIHRIITT